MTKRVGINGFGRIGRLTFRHLMGTDELEVVSINDIVPLDNLAYLLRHDSVHTDPELAVKADEETLYWGDKRIRYSSVRDPAQLPWREQGVDIVIESSGHFTDREGASKHLDAGAAAVVITAPGKNVDITINMGVNEDRFEPGKHRLVSNASCTTNCLSPVAMVLDNEFGIVTGFLTTVHGYTASQNLVDGPNKKWRRGRAAAVSTVPTTTGAAIATTEVLPHLKGKMNGLALRVPVAAGSIIDFVAQTSERVTVDAVNEAFRRAAQTERLRDILGITEEELVSADIIGSNYSALVDARSTMVLGEHAVKVLAWYDNEWGYARRVRDLALYISRRI